MTRSTPVGVSCTVLLLIAMANGAPAQTSVDTVGRIDSVFAEYDRTDGPGCVCGVLRDGAVVAARAYGMTSLELGVPLSTASIPGIGSMSKQFTAASITLLALRGELDLDADIHTYLPEMGDLAARVTVRHLLHHTSGIRDHMQLQWLVGWTNRDYFNNDRIYDSRAGTGIRST
jgi:CubicO group peptidase (beta-lactamase class C family)